jgi:hypothetical protein
MFHIGIGASIFSGHGDVQYFPHLTGKIFQVKGFLEKTVTAAIDDFLGLARNAIAAGEQNPDSGLNLSHPVKGFAAGDSRHDHVQDDEIDLLTFFHKYRQCLLTARRKIDPVVEGFKEFLRYCNEFE